MIRFDAYTATTSHANPYQLMDLLTEVAGQDHTTHKGRGFHTFGNRFAVKDSTGIEIGAVQWGGLQGDLSMIEVKGEPTPEAVKALRERFWHRVTRVDACADFDAPGSFESLLDPCLEVKKAHRLKGSKIGDWDDFPEDGRTLMLGAPTSTCRVRLYEKGKQPEYRHLERSDWTRIEVQVRPVKEAKASFALHSAADVWGATAWTRELAGKVLAEHVDPHPAGTVYRQPERDRALAWMCKQYGAHLVSLQADLGSWECLGLTLREMLSKPE
jgi:DNA relaxase NicK